MSNYGHLAIVICYEIWKNIILSSNYGPIFAKSSNLWENMKIWSILRIHVGRKMVITFQKIKFEFKSFFTPNDKFLQYGI